MIAFLRIFLNIWMNKIVVGVLLRKKEEEGKQDFFLSQNNLRYLYHKCSVIGIMMYDDFDPIDYDVLDMCDMFVIPGGSIIYPYYYEIIDYAIRKKKPVLGICLGMQALGLYTTTKDEFSLKEVDKHYSLENDVHEVYFKEGSILEKILGKKYLVNSRHHYALEEVKAPFEVVGSSLDGVIEAIEYQKEDNLMIGVQFHIEDMQMMDKLYDYFIMYLIKRNG